VIRLGQIVHLRGHAKGDGAAFVVVKEPMHGRIKLVYCGSTRWYVARWFDVADIIVELTENAHVKRARAWLNGATARIHSKAWCMAPEPRNGFLYIDASGNGRDSQWEAVGHVDLPQAWAAPKATASGGVK
jgi:hypothetical protein